jgi:hypothetical protein
MVEHGGKPVLFAYLELRAPARDALEPTPQVLRAAANLPDRPVRLGRHPIR